MKTDPETQQWSKCPDCNGEGWSWHRMRGENVRAQCLSCEGEGEVCSPTVSNRSTSKNAAPPDGSLHPLVSPQPRHYVVLVKSYSVVLVMNAESEEKAYEYASETVWHGDSEIDEMEIESVIDPSDEKEVERARRHANAVAED